MSCALLAWTAFHVMETPGGIGFSALLLLTLMAIFYAAWRGTIAQRQTLKSTEGRLREAIDGLPHGFELYDADDRLVMCNDEVIRHEPYLEGVLKPGVKFETVIRATAMTGIVSEANGRVDEWVAERMARHRNPTGAIENIYSDGRWYMISESRTRSGGTVYLRTDITERKQAEEALRESEARFRNLVESTNVIPWELDLSTWRFTYVGPHAERLTGYPAEDWYAENFWVDHIHASDREFAVALCGEATAKGEDHEFEYRMIAADGRVVWLRDIVTVVLGDDGPEMLRGFMIDITERKQAEEALRINESRLAHAHRLAKLGHWWLDVENDRLRGSPEMAAIFGVEELYVTCDEFMAFVHPDDRHLEALKYGAGVEFDNAYDIEYRIIRPDGELRHIHEIGEPYRDAAGNIIGETGSVQDITERKLAEKSFQEIQNLLMKAQTLGRIGSFVWDEVEDKGLYDSVVMREIFGQSPDDPVETMSSLMERIHPDDRIMYKRETDEALHKGVSLNLEYRIVLPGGEVRNLHEMSDPEFDDTGRVVRSIGMIQDITERKRDEKLLRTVVDSLPQTLSITDADGRYVLINKRLSDYYGFDPDDAIGKHPDELFPPSPNDEKERRELKQVIETGVAITDSEFQYDVDGRVEYRLTSRQPITDSIGNFQYVLTVSSDITEAKLAEIALVAAKEQAELASRAKSEFLANMSHDLRTPLNAIIGFSDMMKNEMLGPIGVPKYSEYVEAISGSGSHLLSMINDILDLSKIESSSARLHEVEVDIGQVIDDVMILLTLKAKSGEVELVKEDSQDLPRINADEDRVRQILSNLLSNAVKFTLPGGIVKIVAERCDKGGLKITVSDTGIGISEDDIPVILEPFGQVDNAMTRKFEGTGLGLPLVRAMIRQHDGDFHIDSEVGVGTSVVVTFPADRII